VDIGSTFQPPVHETMPQDTLIECPNCYTKHTFKVLGTERAATPLEDGLTEGLLVCPECGNETHCYWMSRELREERAKIFGTIGVLAKRRTPINFQRIKELREKYKILFDIEQAKYKEIAEKEDGRTA